MLIVLLGQEDFALAYLDILIFSDTMNDHLKHIDNVLSSLRKHNLKLKPSKCEFFKKDTQYLGFSENGIQPDFDKVTVIRAVSTPTTDSNKDYRRYSDTSDQSIGACLSPLFYDQKKKKETEKPIYFLSHKLSDMQTR